MSIFVFFYVKPKVNTQIYRYRVIWRNISLLNVYKNVEILSKLSVTIAQHNFAFVSQVFQSSLLKWKYIDLIDHLGSYNIVAMDTQGVYLYKLHCDFG